MRYIYRKVYRRNGKFVSRREAHRDPKNCTIDSIPCRIGAHVLGTSVAEVSLGRRPFEWQENES
jgi:hypothetical protein